MSERRCGHIYGIDECMVRESKHGEAAWHEFVDREAEAEQREVERMAYELLMKWSPMWLLDQAREDRTFNDSLRAAYAAAFGGRDVE